MEQNILDLDGKHDYMTNVEKEYNKVVKRFDTKNKEYFDALRELRDQYNKEYDEINAKSNQIIYGNPEGKMNRKNRDRSDLYIKVVRRSEKYKNWSNFLLAIGAAAVFILIFQVTTLFIDARAIFVNEAFDTVCHIILVSAAWSLLVFNSTIQLKSFKYMFTSPRSTRADRKWLKKYFSNIKDIINARAYLDVLVQREEMVEKYLDLADRAISREKTYQKIVDTKNELIEKRCKQFDIAMSIKREAIYQMKKDIEKVMNGFACDADVNIMLGHVLENWKDY